MRVQGVFNILSTAVLSFSRSFARIAFPVVLSAPTTFLSPLHCLVSNSLFQGTLAHTDTFSSRYVLANHTLFQLAEQPPADMAALLAIFRSSVPPMVKKRARELLTVVKNAVKEGMTVAGVGGKLATEDQVSDSYATASTDTVPAIAESLKDQLGIAIVSRKDTVMLDVEMKSLVDAGDSGIVAGSGLVPTSVPTKATDIWGQGGGICVRCLTFELIITWTLSINYTHYR